MSEVVSPKQFSREQVGVMTQWDGKLEPAFKKAKLERQRFEHEVQRDLKKELKYDQYVQQHGERQAAYSRYLKSEEWQNLRLKVLARAKHICEGCGEQPATHVHHLTYDRFGNEMLFDLVAVCESCHKKIHKQTRTMIETNNAMAETIFLTVEQ